MLFTSVNLYFVYICELFIYLFTDQIPVFRILNIDLNINHWEEAL